MFLRFILLGMIDMESLSKNNVREKINIATKLPHSFIKDKETMEKIFNEEISRLKTEYIDYYLMHMTGIFGRLF